jgi:hypothetical protein
MAPLAAASLIEATGSPASPAFLAMATGLLALAGSGWLTRSGGHVLESRAAERPSTAGAGSL